MFSFKQDRKRIGPDQGISMDQPGPIEPEAKKSARLTYLKILVFLFLITYGLIAQFHTPVLTFLGQYLVLKQTPERSDLIVCLAGGNVERGIGAAEVYREGFAPRILLTREDPPDGYRLLEERGLHYPESVDLLKRLLKDLGVPESAIIVSRQPITTTFEEAQLVRSVVAERGYRSLIIITSPTHTRRAWLTFKKVFEGRPVRILVLPTPYSGFDPKDWWKHRKYLREVVIEYQKLIFYTVKHFWS